MKYIAASSIITNRTVTVDGQVSVPYIGGAGIYALAGMKLWSDDVGIVSFAGEDFHEDYGEWMSQNALTERGITPLVPHTMFQDLTYNADGSYGGITTRYPMTKEEWALYFNPPAPQLEQWVDDTKVVYLIRTPDYAYFDGLLEIKKKTGFKLMWEYGPFPGDSVITYRAPVTNLLQRVYELCAQTEMFTINYNEAKDLFGITGVENVLKELQKLPTPFVFYRCGDAGSYTIVNGQAHFIPVLKARDYVDQTGCGNCSTGAAMVAYHQGQDPVMVGIMANMAAHYNVKQYGPWPVVTPKFRDEAHQWAKKLRSAYDPATATFSKVIMFYSWQLFQGC